jgi:hypothetical protein
LSSPFLACDFLRTGFEWVYFSSLGGWQKGKGKNSALINPFSNPMFFVFSFEAEIFYHSFVFFPMVRRVLLLGFEFLWSISCPCNLANLAFLFEPRSDGIVLPAKSPKKTRNKNKK